VESSLDCKKIVKKIYTLENKKSILDFEIFRPSTNPKIFNKSIIIGQRIVAVVRVDRKNWLTNK